MRFQGIYSFSKQALEIVFFFAVLFRNPRQLRLFEFCGTLLKRTRYFYYCLLFIFLLLFINYCLFVFVWKARTAYKTLFSRSDSWRQSLGYKSKGKAFRFSRVVQCEEITSRFWLLLNSLTRAHVGATRSNQLGQRAYSSLYQCSYLHISTEWCVYISWPLGVTSSITPRLMHAIIFDARAREYKTHTEKTRTRCIYVLYTHTHRQCNRGHYNAPGWIQ